MIRDPLLAVAIVVGAWYLAMRYLVDWNPDPWADVDRPPIPAFDEDEWESGWTAWSVSSRQGLDRVSHVRLIARPYDYAKEGE